MTEDVRNKHNGGPEWTRAAAIAGVFAAVLLAGCGGRKAEWRSYREVTVTQPAPAMPPMAGQAADGGAPALEWTVPEGWAETAGSGMRLATFTLGEGAATGVCTIVLLGGNAGGLEANVARWIGQTGAKPPEGEALQAFIGKQQSLKSAGGFDVFIADLTSLAANDEASSMLAAIATIGESTCFVKLTGSAATIKAQKDKFVALCGSLKPKAAPAERAGAGSPPGAASGGLKWRTPQGWDETRGDGMRLATFALGAGGETGTCTLVVLGGSAGGLESNVARWAGQLKLAPMGEADLKSFIARQQTFKSDGGLEVFVADFTALAADDAAGSMLAALVTLGDATGFVKLTGPAGLLKAQRENFLHLCRSLNP